MKKLVALGIALVATLFSFNANSQVPTEKALLWKISGNGLSTPSYLYGTFHLLCEADLQFSDSLKKTVASCKSIYLELDMDDPALPGQMASGMAMKDGHTMKEYMSDSVYKATSRALETIVGIPLDAVSNYKPMLLLSMVYPSALECQPGSPEMEFVKLAQANKVSLNGLESIQDQLDIFDKMPYQMQATELSKYVLDMNLMKSETNEMLNLYRQKDIAGLGDYIKKTEYVTGDLEDIMLGNRNKNWIPKIIDTSKKESTFYAVGAGHLSGENGVINLLRKAGFTVTPIFI
ncbi:MAG: hypothetical protein RL204_6 [Bacteroidota bacterium]|jgi:uncharacterized protein YbaP (TraB family)